MRWPWQPREVRESATSYSQLVSRLIAAQADGQVVQANETASVEACAGLLSRSFAAAEVEADDWAQRAITPRFMSQVGRDFIRVGESLHVIRVDHMGAVHLVPASTWYWDGGANPDDWLVTATAYGPSGSETWRLPAASTVFASWGTATARPYHGIAPTGWASVSGRLAAEAERSLADEAGGPLAQLVAIPSDGGDDGGDDPLAGLKSDITGARGKALLLETTAAGWGEGKSASPMADWKANRLGPAPTQSLVQVAKEAHARVLGACGASPALFDDSDGTSKREALRQWHMGTVRPLAKLLEHELSHRLDTPVKLAFDGYPRDMVSRAQVFAKLIAAEGVTTEKALEIAGLAGSE